MTAAEAFRAAKQARSWDEYRRLLDVAQTELLNERTRLFTQQETHHRKVNRP